MVDIVKTVLKWMVDGDGTEVIYYRTTGFDSILLNLIDSDDDNM